MFDGSFKSHLYPNCKSKEPHSPRIDADELREKIERIKHVKKSQRFPTSTTFPMKQELASGR